MPFFREKDRLGLCILPLQGVLPIKDKEFREQPKQNANYTTKNPVEGPTEAFDAASGEFLSSALTGRLTGCIPNT